MSGKWYIKIWHDGLHGEATEHGPFKTWDEAIDFVDGEEAFEIYER
jgi:hypothetical protein